MKKLITIVGLVAVFIKTNRAEAQRMCMYSRTEAACCFSALTDVIGGSAGWRHAVSSSQTH